MPWTPKLKIIRPRAIPVNLLAYVTDTARQMDAFTWAGDGSLKPLKSYTSHVFANSRPVFPAIAFNDDNDAQSFENEVIEAAYKFVFEVSVQNADPDTAVANARIYDAAIRSMIVNCPAATLLANTGAISAGLITIETGFERVKAHKTQAKDFLQQFQIRPTFTLRAGFLD